MFFKFLAFFFGSSRIENEVFHVSPQEEKARDVLNLTLDALKRDEGSNKKNGRHIPYKDTKKLVTIGYGRNLSCLLYTSPSPRDQRGSRMPSSA